MAKKTNQERNSSRLRRRDFTFEILSEDDHIIVSTLDPKKYDLIEVNGEPAYQDKFTNEVIPISELEDFVNQNKDTIQFISKEQDYCSYLRERKLELLDRWNERYESKDRQLPTSKILEKLSGEDTRIAILYIDLEGSTTMSENVAPEIYQKIIKIFLMQMDLVIQKFKGNVYNHIGDCTIGLFPAGEDFINACDNAIQGAMVMRGVVESVINPVFDEKGLQKIGFHIGLDLGDVPVVPVSTFGSRDSATSHELLGRWMNLVAKIQARAGHNEILLGKRLFELIHNNWQGYCEKVDPDEKWTQQDPEEGGTYQLYRFLRKLEC